MTTLINYNMTRNYCNDWTAIDAIREMAQNALDSNQVCTFSTDRGCIAVSTEKAILPPSAFAMGESRKEGDAIGGYGEGFKVGMLVLTRLGLNPTITSQHLIARGKFVEDAFTGLSTFNIEITESKALNENITFTCDYGDIDIVELKNKITPFSDKPLGKTTSVQRIQGKQGDIYVNGLFVCNDKDLSLGYNFSPSHISLNRDRNMTGGVIWQLGEYWASVGVDGANLLFNLLMQDAKDVADVSYFLNSKPALSAELARLFFNAYGNGATISKPGTTYIGGGGGVSVGHSAGRAFAKAGVPETTLAVDEDAPTEVLNRFALKHKKSLRRDVRNDLEKLTTRAKTWKKPGTY